MSQCGHWIGSPVNKCTEPADYVQGILAECEHAGKTCRHCREHAEYWANSVVYCCECDAPARFTEPVRVAA